MSKRDIDRYAIIQKYIDNLITRTHASELLHLTVRHVTRLKQAVRKFGASALIHKQRGKPSHHRLNEEVRTKIVLLLKEKYRDFGPTFAAEKLREVHKIDHDPKTIRSIQMKEGLWKGRKTKKKEEHRSWRQRRSSFGEMEQFDGSYHDWFEGRGGITKACLLVSIDDATSKITHAVFAQHEGVFPVLAFWKTYVETHGKPRSIYMDKFSTYKMNSAVAKDNPDLKTQFEQVLRSLQTESIFANSPQGKGRVERLNDTLQDRLPKEMRLLHISTYEEANIFLRDVFIPDFNRRFAVEPLSPLNLHKPLTSKEQTLLPSIFSRKEERTVQNDFTFSFKNVWYQVQKQQSVYVQRKDVVQIEEWLDHTIHVRLRTKELNILLLPERPKKTNTQSILPKIPSIPWKPAKDHPWRQRFTADVQKSLSH